MPIDGFDVFAIIVFAVLLAAVVFIVVELGSLPGRMRSNRGASLCGGSQRGGLDRLITLGALWPIALVWAFLPLPSLRQASDVTAKDRGKAAPSMSFRDLVGLPRLARIPPFFREPPADRLTLAVTTLLRSRSDTTDVKKSKTLRFFLTGRQFDSPA